MATACSNEPNMNKESPKMSNSSPLCIIVMGMAGSGKTAFVHALTSYLVAKGDKPYTINLDPAVYHVPYPTNVDIRDTVKYKEVMKQYGLGPNGAIMTSLNLFATKIDQVLNLIEQNSAPPASPDTEVLQSTEPVADGNAKFRYVIIDTPGQIEVFTWSASGIIITETLASAFPTIVVYVMDTPRSHSPTTFMSNMLYACSILYKTRLPFLVLLNKTDIIDCDFALEWMRDFESFQEALNAQSANETDNYMTGLTHSMSLVLDEFYENLRACGVSSVTGDGMDKVEQLLGEARTEYFELYRPELEKLFKRKLASQAAGSSSSVGPGGDSDLMSGRETAGGLFIRHARQPGEEESTDEDEMQTEDLDEKDPDENEEAQSFQRFVQMHKDGRFTDKNTKPGEIIDANCDVKIETHADKV